MLASKTSIDITRNCIINNNIRVFSPNLFLMNFFLQIGQSFEDKLIPRVKTAKYKRTGN